MQLQSDSKTTSITEDMPQGTEKDIQPPQQGNPLIYKREQY
jgi:hypothetical protein